MFVRLQSITLLIQRNKNYKLQACIVNIFQEALFWVQVKIQGSGDPWEKINFINPCIEKHMNDSSKKHGLIITKVKFTCC